MSTGIGTKNVRESYLPLIS